MLTCYSPVRRSCTPKEALPLDLHVLSTPPAFVLSQDQTLHRKTENPNPTNKNTDKTTVTKNKQTKISSTFDTLLSSQTSNTHHNTPSKEGRCSGECRLNRAPDRSVLRPAALGNTQNITQPARTSQIGCKRGGRNRIGPGQNAFMGLPEPMISTPAIDRFPRRRTASDPYSSGPADRRESGSVTRSLLT